MNGKINLLSFLSEKQIMEVDKMGKIAQKTTK